MSDKFDFLKPDTKWAVIGASTNEDKYGYKIYRKLKSKGYKVYPVNPNCEQVLGDKCYPDLNSLPEKVDIIDMVIPPKSRGRYTLSDGAATAPLPALVAEVWAAE